MNVKMLFVIIFIFSFNFIFASENNISDPPIVNNMPNDNELRKCLIIGITLSSIGSTIFITGIAMGFIPYGILSQEMKTYQDTPYIHYPYLTIFTSIGASLYISGAILLLIGVPLFIYYLVSNKAINDEKSKISFTGNGLSIKLDFRS